MTLRRLLNLVVWLFAVLVLMGATSLIWSTTLLRQRSDEIVRDFEGIRLMKELQVNLFRYRYNDRLWTRYGEDEHYFRREEARDELNHAYNELRRTADSSSMAQRLQALRSEIDSYFLKLEIAHREFNPDGNRVHDAVDPLFQKLNGTLDRLVDETSASVYASQASSRRLDDQMTIAGSILGLIALALSVQIGRLLWRQLYFPVSRLQERLERYARGDRSARCDLSAPLELAEIGTTFNHLADQLEAQRTAQLRFLAAVAHDLRNPLASMKLYSQLVKRDRPLPQPEKIHKAFEVIGRQVDRLSRMTSDLLDASRIEAGELELNFEPVDLAQIAREVVSLLEENATPHQLLLEGPDELEVVGDSTRLYQVLMNLISNALKYSPQGGTVKVRLARRHDEVVMSVADEGVGISPSELEHIFEPFHRSGGLKDNIPGVGLGLSVTRRIVEAHGGRIEVKSAPEQGSTFQVVLPAITGASLSLREESLRPPPHPRAFH